MGQKVQNEHPPPHFGRGRMGEGVGVINKNKQRNGKKSLKKVKAIAKENTEATKNICPRSKQACIRKYVSRAKAEFMLF